MDFISTFIGKDQNTGEGQLPNNLFDRLPDDIIYIIFRKVQDVKTLFHCFSLSKRFAYIISQFEVVSLSFVLPHQHNNDDKDNDNNNNNNNLNDGNLVNTVKSKINYLITKFRGDNDPVANSLCQRLRIFQQIKHLHLELHTDSVEDVMPEFLKWKATYGSKLKTCTMLCAKRLDQLAANETSRAGMMQKPILVAYYFKSPMKWLKSCMTAASERHRLVKHVVAQFPTLETVTITDSKRRGRFYMARGDVRDLRESLKRERSLWELLKQGFAPTKRLRPKLPLRLWYAYLLELPTFRCDWVDPMLFVIEPAGDNKEMVRLVEENEAVGGGFDGDSEEKAMFAEAEREIMIANQSLNRTLDYFNVVR